MAQYEFFPADFITLRMEAIQHPELRDRLRGANDLGSYFATICTYLGIAIDGYFYSTELPQLCQTLSDKLYEKRTSIYVSH